MWQRLNKCGTINFDELVTQQHLYNSTTTVQWRHRNNNTSKIGKEMYFLMPWWWSSGQYSPLLLQQSKFESYFKALSFSVKFLFDRNENKQKEAGCGSFNKDLYLMLNTQCRYNQCEKALAQWPTLSERYCHLLGKT